MIFKITDLVPYSLIKFTIISSSFLVGPLGFSKSTIMLSSVNKGSFTSFQSFLLFASTFALLHWLRNLVQCRTKVVRVSISGYTLLPQNMNASAFDGAYFFQPFPTALVTKTHPMVSFDFSFITSLYSEGQNAIFKNKVRQ